MEVTRGSELLKLRTLRSPIDGVVMERTLGPGEYVGSDQTHLLTIAQSKCMCRSVSSERFASACKARFGGRYIAHVTVVDRVYDAASATVGVRLELPNPGIEIPAGLTCQVRFAGIG